MDAMRYKVNGEKKRRLEASNGARASELALTSTTINNKLRWNKKRQANAITKSIIVFN